MSRRIRMLLKISGDTSESGKSLILGETRKEVITETKEVKMFYNTFYKIFSFKNAFIVSIPILLSNDPLFVCFARYNLSSWVGVTYTTIKLKRVHVASPLLTLHSCTI